MNTNDSALHIGSSWESSSLFLWCQVHVQSQGEVACFYLSSTNISVLICSVFGIYEGDQGRYSQKNAVVFLEDTDSQQASKSVRDRFGSWSAGLACLCTVLTCNKLDLKLLEQNVVRLSSHAYLLPLRLSIYQAAKSQFTSRSLIFGLF